MITASDFLTIAEDMNLLTRLVAGQQAEKLNAEIEMGLQEYALMAETDYATLGSNDKARDAAKARLLRGDGTTAWAKAETRWHNAKWKLITAESNLRQLTNTRRAYESYLEAVKAGLPIDHDEPPATEPDSTED